jgi:hypothetical protein
MIFIGAALMLLDAYLHPEVKDESQTEKNNIV